jgi:MFS family permease
MWITGLIGCFTFLPISGFAEAWAPNYLATVGFSNMDAALGSSLIFLGFALGAPFWGFFSEWVKSRRLPLILGSLLAALCMIFVIRMPTTDAMPMYWALFLAGFFTGVEILIFAVGNDLADSSVSATAAAFSNMVVTLAGAVLAPIVGRLLDNSMLHSGMTEPTIENFSFALTAIPISLILAALLSVLLKESHPMSVKVEGRTEVLKSYS